MFPGAMVRSPVSGPVIGARSMTMRHFENAAIAEQLITVMPLQTTSANSGPAAAEAIYACPMHPDVTGKAGDRCPKCGMALEERGVI